MSEAVDQLTLRKRSQFPGKGVKMNNLSLLKLAIMLPLNNASFYSPAGRSTGDSQVKNQLSPNNSCSGRNPNVSEKPTGNAVEAMGPQFPYSEGNPLGYKKISEATNPQNGGDL